MISICKRTIAARILITKFKGIITIFKQFTPIGRALNYGIILFFKYLLPADDLKYFSLVIASSLVSNSSNYISSKGI
jgi:hypothetical protein